MKLSGDFCTPWHFAQVYDRIFILLPNFTLPAYVPELTEKLLDWVRDSDVYPLIKPAVAAPVLGLPELLAALEMSSIVISPKYSLRHFV